MKGFTIIELLIVALIIGLISSIGIFNSGKLSNGLLLHNTAYDLSLAINQAQRYGLGVSNSNDTNFEYAFGVNISEFNYKFFKDIGNDDDFAPSEIVGREIPIQNDKLIKINGLCVDEVEGYDFNGSNKICDSARSIDEVNILSRRPVPEIIVSYKNGGIKIMGKTPIIISLTAGADNCKSLIVYLTGQVEIFDKSAGYCVP